MTRQVATFRIRGLLPPPPPVLPPPPPVLPPPPPPDIIAPTVNITSPQSGAVVTGTSVTVSGTSADAQSGIERTEVSLDGQPMALANGTTSWSKQFINVPEGVRVITARSRDNAGNWSEIGVQSFRMEALPFPPPPPPPSGTGKYVAQNGVLQIYGNNPRLPIWVMGFGNWQDREDGEGSRTGTGVNTVNTLSGQVRWGVLCTPSADINIEQNHAINLQRGWSDTSNDFVSIEQTGYVDITSLASSDGDQDATWFGPTGRHTGGGTPTGCMGSTYKGSLHARTGNNRMAKENYHVEYSYISWIATLASFIQQMNGRGLRVGFKWVNMRVGNYRRCELWVDISAAINYSQSPGNRWQLIRVQEDHGDWPGSCCMGGCGVPERQPILWGAPSVVFRWDNQTGKISLATVQEIAVPSQFHQVGAIITV